jgi:hypothetical protein
LLLGDSNIHVDDKKNKQAQEFLSNLACSNLCQHVNVSTHKQGHTLDLVITRNAELQIADMQRDSSIESDHLMVIFTASVPKMLAQRNTISYRRWKCVDHDQFQKDICNQMIIPDTSSVEESVNIYNSVLSKLVDTHAPLQHRTVTIRPQTPWFNEDIKENKQLRRKLERQWFRTGLTVHYEMLCAQRNKLNNLIRDC